MDTFFHHLYDYNFFCNKSLIDKCLTEKTISKKTASLFSHILNAHHIWNMRILETPVQYKIWQVHDVEQWEAIHYENQRTTFEIINNADDLEKRVEYINFKKRQYSNTLQEILFHVINHSTHERAKITVDFRLSNIEPLALDYIFYKR